MIRLAVLLSFAVFGAFAFDAKDVREGLLVDADLEAAKEKCFAELKLTAEDLGKEIKAATPEKIPEKLACLIKCVQEQTGYVDEKKMFVMDKIENLPIFAKIAEDKKNNIVECLGSMGPIEECADVQKIRDCFMKFLT